MSLDSRVREIINKNMMSPTQRTFDEAQLQIYTLMHRDSYPRFVNSPVYRNLLRTYGGSVADLSVMPATWRSSGEKYEQVKMRETLLTRLTMELCFGTSENHSHDRSNSGQRFTLSPPPFLHLDWIFLWRLLRTVHCPSGNGILLVLFFALSVGFR